MTGPRPDEMPADPGPGTMPTYTRIMDWLQPEITGLSQAQLDFHDPHPDREWMWWSIRRQVSHLAWTALVFPYRRCHHLLWPDGPIPEPIDWSQHLMGPQSRWDRLLDENRHHEPDQLLPLLVTGLGWLQRVVDEHPIETLRADKATVHGTPFWTYVIQVLPRGAEPVADRPTHIRYDLEGSLWMVFYELAAHVRTIQRLKAAQGLDRAVDLPRFGYLRLPEYWGDTDANGPDMTRHGQ